MRGHIPTPESVAEDMVDRLFEAKPPTAEDSVLSPGIGTAPLAQCIVEFCQKEGLEVPELVGVESDLEIVKESEGVYSRYDVDVFYRDFLVADLDLGSFDYILGNPPYVPIENISPMEKEYYRDRYETAVGRFNLYQLFFERSLSLLEPGGRLVFITPEKFEYIQSAIPLRELLTQYSVKEIEHLPEGTFEGFTTYPAITVVENGARDTTEVVNREGEQRTVELPRGGESWASTIRGGTTEDLTGSQTLGDICYRISPGVATGADRIFVQEEDEVPEQIEPWTFPTVSGRQLNISDGVQTDTVFVCPYREGEGLVDESELGKLEDWLEIREDRLRERSCVSKEDRTWYCWHENPPLEDILQEKVVFQDVTHEPKFWHDPAGEIVPRHSVYYLIPKEGVEVPEIMDYLNSDEVASWCFDNCQKAANGYIRLQSRTLEDLPVPEYLAGG